MVDQLPAFRHTFSSVDNIAANVPMVNERESGDVSIQWVVAAAFTATLLSLVVMGSGSLSEWLEYGTSLCQMGSFGAGIQCLP